MNEYLLADANRLAVIAHNEDLVATTTKQIGKASYTSYDFNRPEEFAQLSALIAQPNADTLTVPAIAQSIYGDNADALLRRVHGFLRFNSTYQKTLVNGSAVVANVDGTLRITRTPDEYGDLFDEHIAAKVTRMTKYDRNGLDRLGRDFVNATTKVPAIAARLETTKQESAVALESNFTRHLALMSGGSV